MFYSNTNLMHSIIDYIFSSKSYLNSCISAEIGNKLISDRAWVMCQVSQRNIDDKGPNWTLNRTLIKDDIYKTKIEEEIKQYFDLNQNCGVPIPVV